MAAVMALIAVKMFWKTSLAKARLSPSENPSPWMILICLINVVLPLSPVPTKEQQWNEQDEKLEVKYWKKRYQKHRAQWNVNYPVKDEAAEHLRCFSHKQTNWKSLSQGVLHRGNFTPRIQGVKISPLFSSTHKQMFTFHFILCY